MFRVTLDYMLGIQPKTDGILINPCIPELWEEYEVTRHFRKNVYKFRIHNPNNNQTGVSYIVEDGVRRNDNFVKYTEDFKEHIIDVYMK